MAYVAAAAAAMLVLAVGIVAGHAVVTCAQGPAGLAACFGQRLADLLPAAPGPAATSAPTTPEAESAASGDTPAITLLRVEPDGSLVVAGTGRPGARLEVLADGELLGTADAEPSGDWVVVPETPLRAGGVEITVAEAGGGARGAQSFVVVIDPAGGAEPLVIAAGPGEAGRILQGLPPLLAPAPSGN